MKALRALRRPVHHEDVKRDLVVTIRMAAEDLHLFREAAAKLWPADAPPTNSTLVLTLARMQARQIVKKKGRPAER